MANRIEKMARAAIGRDETTGIAVEEEWRTHGKLHRIGGPALISRDNSSGIATSVSYFEHGIEIPAPSTIGVDIQPA